jgi:hypothetical protein
VAWELGGWEDGSWEDGVWEGLDTTSIVRPVSTAAAGDWVVVGTGTLHAVTSDELDETGALSASQNVSTRTVELRQGLTTLVSWPLTLTPELTTYRRTLTPSEMAMITNFSDLSLRFTDDGGAPMTLTFPPMTLVADTLTLAVRARTYL